MKNIYTMKFLYIILMSALALSPATYAEGVGNAGRSSTIQPDRITVKGKILDENGDPLPGATIQEKNTTNGIISDVDGAFTLSVPPDATLIVSYIGYKSLEIQVGGRADVGAITLFLDTQQLEEVVVIGYGTQRKVDLTGSVAVVNVDEMKKVSNSNMSTMLQGRIPGVQVTTDGQPGADPVVRIRGISSFGSTSPLYVVDGVIIGTTVRDFSPNDIESIQVLKDASAAAIYGSRAANGVVIITTKQGKKNQPMRVDYSGYVGMDKVEDGVYHVMDSRQYGQYITMAFNNFNMDVPAGYDPTSEKYIDPDVVNTNWQDAAFKTGVRQNHNINLSGGGENNTYNISLDYFSQEGTIVGAGPNFDRYTARLNNTMHVKFIKLKTSVVYSHIDQDNMALSNANEFVQGLYGAQYPVMASALITPPTIKAYDESTWVLDDKLEAASQYTYDSYGFGTYYDDVHGDIRVTNVLLTNSLLKRNVIVDRIMASGTANIDLIGMIGLKSSAHKFEYSLNLSYNKTFAKDFTFVPAFIQSTTNYLAKSNEVLSQGYRNYGSSLIENFVTYDGSIGRNHLNVVAGISFQHDPFHTLTGRGIALTEPYYLQIGNSGDQDADSFESEEFLASYFGRLNYAFDEKYLLSATIRRDGSSRLSPEDRWDWFPSVSAGWRIDRESFFPVSKSTINLLKIRGSYGELGNIFNLGSYDYMDVMERGDYSYSFGNEKVTGSAISNFVNERIRWERRKTLDVGLDLGMFNNQLELSFEWYKSTTEELHYGVPVPTQAGFTNASVRMNAATMVNSGFEFMVTYSNDQNPVKFNISANLATLKNEVTKLGVSNEPRTDGFSRTEVGREIGQLYGYVANGIFRSQDEIDNNLNSEGEPVVQNVNAQGESIDKVGDVRYVDLNNDGKITSDDRTFLGSGIPDVTFGLNARVEWKGVDLSVMTFGAAGFKAVDFVDLTLRSSYGTLNKSVELLNAWTPENPNTDVPRVSYRPEGSITNDLFSQRFIQDASYLKVASVELGYVFPNRFFGEYLKNVRLYARGQNLAVFSKYRGYNVDFAGGTFTPGYNYASYPTPQSVMFGAQFSF